MPRTVLPFLMFQGDAEAALDFYRDRLGATIDGIERYGEDEPVAAGALKTARLTVCGQEVMVFDSPPMHSFGFTPSFSFYVECGDEDEVRKLAATFADGGQTLMGADNYGFSKLYAWVSDRFGISWQFNCA